MYDFHYSYMKTKYGDKAKPLFTDTEFLTCEIQANHVYKDFHEDKQMFDHSDYPSDSPFYFNNNKNVIGKMKDETADCPIVEFAKLLSKSTAISKTAKA